MTTILKCNGCESICDRNEVTKLQIILQGDSWKNRKDKDFCGACLKQYFSGAKVVLGY